MYGAIVVSGTIIGSLDPDAKEGGEEDKGKALGTFLRLGVENMPEDKVMTGTFSGMNDGLRSSWLATLDKGRELFKRRFSFSRSWMAVKNRASRVLSPGVLRVFRCTLSRRRRLMLICDWMSESRLRTWTAFWNAREGELEGEFVTNTGGILASFSNLTLFRLSSCFGAFESRFMGMTGSEGSNLTLGYLGSGFRPDDNKDNWSSVAPTDPLGVSIVRTGVDSSACSKL